MAHFRNTYKPARFFFMDVRVGVIVLASMMHIRFYTISLDFITIVLAWYVERLGMTIPGAVRALRAWVAGPYRPAQNAHKVRRKVDYEYERLDWQQKRITGEIQLQEVIIEKDASLMVKSSKAGTVKAKK
jgi:intracellular multiplication protein IcmT